MIIPQIASDLELEIGPTRVERLAAKPSHGVVGVPKPTRRGGVGAHSGFSDPVFFEGLSGRPALKEFAGFGWRKSIREITKVDARHHLRRGHIDEQFPQRLAFVLGPQIPNGIDDCRGGQVNNPFVRPQPSQLRITQQMTPEPGHVAGDRLELETERAATARESRRKPLYCPGQS